MVKKFKCSHYNDFCFHPLVPPSHWECFSKTIVGKILRWVWKNTHPDNRNNKKLNLMSWIGEKMWIFLKGLFREGFEGNKSFHWRYNRVWKMGKRLTWKIFEFLQLKGATIFLASSTKKFLKYMIMGEGANNLNSGIKKYKSFLKRFLIFVHYKEKGQLNSPCCTAY